MSSIIQLDDQRGVVELDGALTLNQVAELKSLFIKALIKADDVRVRFGEVVEADLSCLQLLCSAHRSALRLNKHFAIEGATPQALTDVMNTAGYARSAGCKLDKDHSCLWAALCGGNHA